VRRRAPPTARRARAPPGLASRALRPSPPLPPCARSLQIENGFDSTITFVTLGAADVPTGHRVASSDPLSVTLEWGQGAADAAAAGFAHPRARRDASASAPVVRGSPYVTMEYLGATPVFDSPQMLDPQIGLTVDGEPQTCPGVFEGSKFEVVLVQSDETWTIWSSARVQVGCQTDGALLTAQAPFDGVWRAAVTNNCTLGRSAFHCRKAPPADAEPTRFGALLDQHARTYPVGADVDMKASGDSASLRIQWKTRQMPDDAYDAHDAHAAPARGAGGGGRGGRGGGARRTPQLLMAAMEHHRALGLCATAAPAGLARHSEVYARNINGAVSLVQSDEWLLPYALLPVGWHSTHGVADAQRGAVLDALRDDAEWEVPANYAIGAGDPYNAGKMLSRIGTLALIAEELGEAELARKVGRKLSRLVEVYSSGARLRARRARAGGVSGLRATAVRRARALRTRARARPQLIPRPSLAAAIGPGARWRPRIPRPRRLLAVSPFLPLSLPRSLPRWLPPRPCAQPLCVRQLVGRLHLLRLPLRRLPAQGLQPERRAARHLPLRARAGLLQERGQRRLPDDDGPWPRLWQRLLQRPSLPLGLPPLRGGRRRAARPRVGRAEPRAATALRARHRQPVGARRLLPAMAAQGLVHGIQLGQWLRARRRRALPQRAQPGVDLRVDQRLPRPAAPRRRARRRGHARLGPSRARVRGRGRADVLADRAGLKGLPGHPAAKDGALLREGVEREVSGGSGFCSAWGPSGLPLLVGWPAGGAHTHLAAARVRAPARCPRACAEPSYPPVPC
jgi:hypothetical protein